MTFTASRSKDRLIHPNQQNERATNETIAGQLARTARSAPARISLTEAEVTTLMDVARRTATSSFLQSCTILHITDPRCVRRSAPRRPAVGGTKERSVHLRGRPVQQPHPRRAGGYRPGVRSTCSSALEDALLAAQNVVVAAESMGLGAVLPPARSPIARTVVKALELPELTFPIVGLLVGHPD